MVLLKKLEEYKTICKRLDNATDFDYSYNTDMNEYFNELKKESNEELLASGFTPE